MNNLFVGPFGLTDKFGTNIANYDLRYDPGFLDIPSQAAAIFTGLLYHLILLPVSALGLKAMELVMSPDSVLTPLSNLYRRLVDPIFEIVSFPLLAILAVGILFVYISFDTIRYTSSFRQDSERIIVGVALAFVAVVLARDPFGPVAFVLRSLREIIRDMTRGDSLAGSTVDSFLAPITQALSYGQPLNAQCSEQWSRMLARGGDPTCVEPLSDVGFGMTGAAILGTIAGLSLIAFAGLALFRMAIHLFGGTWRLAVIPYAVLATIVQRRKYVTISNLLGMAAAHYVMVLIVMVLSLIGPPLFTAFMSDIVGGGNSNSTARMAIGMVVMTLGYAAMTYLLHRISQSSGTLARTLRLSTQRNLDAHLGAPVGYGGHSMLNPAKDDLAAGQVAAVTGGAKKAGNFLSEKLLGETMFDDDDKTGTPGAGGRSSDGRAADVTQDEAVASPFATALAPDFIVLDENGQFHTRDLPGGGNRTKGKSRIGGAVSGAVSGGLSGGGVAGAAKGAVTGAVGTAGGAAPGIVSAAVSGAVSGAVAGNLPGAAAGAAIGAAGALAARGGKGTPDLPMDEKTQFRGQQFDAMASGLYVPSGAKGSAIHGRAPAPVGVDVEPPAIGDEGTDTRKDAREREVGTGTADQDHQEDRAGQIDMDDERPMDIDPGVEDYGSAMPAREMPRGEDAEDPVDSLSGSTEGGIGGGDLPQRTEDQEQDQPSSGGRHRAPEPGQPSEHHVEVSADPTPPAPPVAPGVLGGTGEAVSTPALAEPEPTAPSSETSGTDHSGQRHADSAPDTSQPPAQDYPKLGMSQVDRDMAFLETGQAPAPSQPTPAAAPATPELLGSVSSPSVDETEFVDTASASVPSATFVAEREAATDSARMVSAAMGHGDFTVVPEDDPSLILDFVVSDSGENVAIPRHDFGFGP